MQGPTELMCKNVLFPGDPQMPGKRHITPSDPWDCHLPSLTGREGDCPQLPGHPSLVPPRPWRHLATWQDRAVGPPPGSEQGSWPSRLPGGQEGQVCTLVPDRPRGQWALEGPRHLALGSQAEHVSNSGASWGGGGMCCCPEGHSSPLPSWAGAARGPDWPSSGQSWWPSQDQCCQRHKQQVSTRANIPDKRGPERSSAFRRHRFRSRDVGDSD